LVGPAIVGALARAHVRTRVVDAAVTISDHFCMPAFPRCGALLRNGQPCGRTAAADSEFCGHHTELLESVDAERLREGKIPKKRTLRQSPLRVIGSRVPRSQEMSSRPRP